MKAANDDIVLAEDRDHWLERAEHHLSLGEQAADTRASWAHFQLAGRYLDRAYGDGGGEDGWESRPPQVSILQ